nr:hypothetical protein [Mycobacterium uberis]
MANLLPKTVTLMVSPACATRAHSDAQPSHNANSIFTVLTAKLGFASGITTLVPTSEPHPYPHRRIHGTLGKHPIVIGAQPQVARANLASVGYSELVVASTQ